MSVHDYTPHPFHPSVLEAFKTVPIEELYDRVHAALSNAQILLSSAGRPTYVPLPSGKVYFARLNVTREVAQHLVDVAWAETLFLAEQRDELAYFDRYLNPGKYSRSRPTLKGGFLLGPTLTDIGDYQNV